MAIKDEMEDVQEAVINELITENGITNTLADDQVTEAKIDDGAVTPAKLSQAYLPLTGGSVTGNVLVGKTAAGFQIVGTELAPSGFAFFTRDGGAPVQINRKSSNGAIAEFYKDQSARGSISVSGSSTAFNTSSDYRLKEDLVEMEDSIERVKALKPINFAWKLDGTRVDGFLAHEAQEVVPEAVTGTKDAVDDEGNPEYQGIDQAKLVPLLTKALQEALTKIESLEARVASLENT